MRIDGVVGVRVGDVRVGRSVMCALCMGGVFGMWCIYNVHGVMYALTVCLICILCQTCSVQNCDVLTIRPKSLSSLKLYVTYFYAEIRLKYLACDF